MKKMICLVLALVFLCSAAYASDFPPNRLYNFAKSEGYFFLLPQGFELLGSEDDVSVYQNAAGESVSVMSYAEESNFGNESTQAILDEMDRIYANAFGSDWAGMFYGEKSGGCYKIGSIMFGDSDFMIIAINETHAAIIIIQNLDLSNGYDLPYGIFKTLSSIE